MPNFFETMGGPLAGGATLLRGGSFKDALKNSIPLPTQLMTSLFGIKGMSPAFNKGGSMGFLGMNKDKKNQGEAQPTQYANTQTGGQPQGQAPQGQYAGTQAPNPYYQQYQMAQQPRQGGM